MIIAVWYIAFISNQTLEQQNTAFKALNTFSEYYKLACTFEEARIGGVRIEVVPLSIITVENKEVCIETEHFLKTCTKVICGANSGNWEFELDEKYNYFNFTKTPPPDNTITIELQK